MCAPRNGTIYRTCRDLLLKQTGRKSMSNQEMRRLLKLRGGCMNGAHQDQLTKLLKTERLITVGGESR